MNRSELLFACMCIPTRILLALEGREAPDWLIVTASLISAGFMYIWLSGARTVGVETGGRPIWWNNIRPIHSLLWLAFVIGALRGSPQAWKFLAFDVVLGLAAFFFYK